MTKADEGKRARSLKSPWLRRLLMLLLGLSLAVVAYLVMFSMPGTSHQGSLPAPTTSQKAMATALRQSVTYLAGTLGQRNTFHYHKLQQAQGAIEMRFKALGYQVRRYGFKMRHPGARFDGQWVYNIEAQRPGSTRPKEILVVGAHYDSVLGSPGANDNASGVAGLLALADMLRKARPRRTLRFVAFVNEEPPYFRTSRMGSLYYARRCQHRKDNIIGMISLETIGYFSDRPGSQRYPPPLGLLYPSTGHFIGFVSDVGSRSLLHKAIGSFRRHSKLPSEGVATLALLPGIGWSDHWAFWQAGYKAIMVTDTAPYRYPHYHKSSDTPDKLDYRRMALVVEGMEKVIQALVSP